MKLHGNAPLGPKGRRRMALLVTEEGLTLTAAAEAAGVSVRTAGKWVRRYRAEGEAGLLDRSSAPRRVHNVTPAQRVEAIAALRRLRMTGPAPRSPRPWTWRPRPSPRSWRGSASAGSRAWSPRSRSAATSDPLPTSSSTST